MLLFYRYCFVIKAYYINTLYYVAIKGNTWYMYIYIYIKLSPRFLSVLLPRW